MSNTVSKVTVVIRQRVHRLRSLGEFVNLQSPDCSCIRRQFASSAQSLSTAKPRRADSLPRHVASRMGNSWCWQTWNILPVDQSAPRKSPVSGILRALSSSRSFSSSSGQGGFRNVYAIPFSVAPEDALVEFDRWATEDQGLTSFLGLKPYNIMIAAAYAPVWSFDVNVRFATRDVTTNRTVYTRKPEPFQSAFAQTSTVYVPGLSAYAGHSYRRSLINPIHNTTLIYMSDQILPFSSNLMRPIRMRSTGGLLEIFPDPWNTTQGRAYAIVQDGLNELARQDIGRIGECEVKTELVRARRVHMPTYVIDYTVLGSTYRAFLSGCDSAVPTSGVDHTAFSFNSDAALQYSNRFLSQVSSVGRLLDSRTLARFWPFVLGLVQLALRVLSRVFVVGGVLGAGFVAFRKVLRPYLENRSANAEWERQREHEALLLRQKGTDLHYQDDFTDVSGSGRRYFETHKTHILHVLSGQADREAAQQDDPEQAWYRQWEEWARQQYEQQQQQQQHQNPFGQNPFGQNPFGQNPFGQQQQQQQQQQQKSRQQQRRAPPKQEYQWDFDPSDPYSVLNVPRTATQEQISQAFRREMMKHHPDMQANAPQAEKDKAVERSKLITNAYRQLKAKR